MLEGEGRFPNRPYGGGSGWILAPRLYGAGSARGKREGAWMTGEGDDEGREDGRLGEGGRGMDPRIHEDNGGARVVPEPPLRKGVGLDSCSRLHEVRLCAGITGGGLDDRGGAH